MHTALAIIVGLTFVALALWHFGMVFWPDKGLSGAVPSEFGKPLFVPSVKATLAVGLALLAVACLMAAAAGLVEVGLPKRGLAWSCDLLALGLLARAVGEFKYVGFFKRVRGSRFARLDTWLYSPLCLTLAIGVAFIGSDAAKR